MRAGPYVMKGDREFTLPELNRVVQSDVPAIVGRPDRYRSFVFEFHHRLGFAISPLTFCAFALILTIRRRAKPIAALAAIGIAAVGYDATRWLGNALSLSESVAPQLGAWMPQIALLVTTIVVGVPRTSIRRRA